MAYRFKNPIRVNDRVRYGLWWIQMNKQTGALNLRNRRGTVKAVANGRASVEWDDAPNVLDTVTTECLSTRKVNATVKKPSTRQSRKIAA